MKKSFSVLLVVVLSFCATAAFAGNVYFSGSGGFTLVQDAEIKDAVPSQTIEFENGWNAGGAIGYDFGMFRTEFEISYRNNGLDILDVGGVEAPLSGSITATSFLVNGIIDLENKSNLTPFIGVGIGAANLSINDAAVLGVVIVDDSTTVFGYKVMTGIDYAFSPEFSLTADYTFFGTANPTFENVAGADFKSEYHSHNINAGFKYNF